MGKPANKSRVAENEARAYLNRVRISPRKLNLVAQMIRGRDVSAAMADLAFCERRIALDVKKLLQTAVANAENNHQLEVDRLYVAEATVGPSIAMKRFHTRGRGRSAQIVKPFSNMTLIVRERESEAK
ncbi:MAG: 50S ribosomal protein L22 [Alphaproteobacteria bacterium GWF2_58_20]|nr:MAG: 50S ribosomal protein L22 [Alphaproteobacteria bacterium GWF2_58_20]